MSTIQQSESNRTIIDLSGLEFEEITNHFHYELDTKNNYMERFIDTEIEKYFQSNLMKSFDKEWIWSSMNRLLIPIKMFVNIVRKQKFFIDDSNKPLIENVSDLCTRLNNFESYWFSCRIATHDGWKEDSSKFMVLVHERMKKSKFSKRVKEWIKVNH